MFNKIASLGGAVMIVHGLVFKIDGTLFFAVYDDEGNIQNADSISDDEVIYDDLPCNALSFCSVEVTNERFNIKDLHTITLTDESKSIKDIISAKDFPRFAKDIW